MNIVLHALERKLHFSFLDGSFQAIVVHEAPRISSLFPEAMYPSSARQRRKAFMTG